MDFLFFSQRLYLEREYYKWKVELDNKAHCVSLDCPMLVVSFLQSRGYLNVDKVLEDWRVEAKSLIKKHENEMTKRFENKENEE